MPKLDGAKLRSLRQRAGLSQDAMARRAGVDERTLRRAERGQTEPHGETVRIFAATLGVDVAELFEDEASGIEELHGVAAHRPLDRRPVLAVLPFVERGPHPDLENFAYGLLEDLIARLSLRRTFHVISRNTMLLYADASVASRKVSEELSADYVVEGSVGLDAATARISVSLVDGRSGHQIWADGSRTRRGDILGLQEEIASQVAASMSRVLMRNEMRRARRISPRDLDAWEAAVRGLWYLDRREPESNQESRQHFLRARELDSAFVLPYYGTALSHYTDLLNGWTDSLERSVEGLVGAAAEAEACDPEDPHALLAAGYAWAIRGERNTAIERSRHAISVNPSAVRARLLLGALVGEEQPDEALLILRDGIRLSPRDPMIWAFEAAIAKAHFVSMKLDEALAWALKAERSGPVDVMVQAMLISLYGHLHDLAAVRKRIDAFHARWPDVSIATLERAIASLCPADRAHFIAGLRRAGF